MDILIKLVAIIFSATAYRLKLYPDFFIINSWKLQVSITNIIDYSYDSCYLNKHIFQTHTHVGKKSIVRR